MADRVLTWFIDALVGDGTEVGPVYYMESTYEPVGLHIYARLKPTAGAVEVDVLDDGVSILAQKARLTSGSQADEIAEEWKRPKPEIKEGSWVSLTINPETKGGKGISVQLDLDRLED